MLVVVDIAVAEPEAVGSDVIDVMALGVTRELAVIEGVGLAVVLAVMKAEVDAVTEGVTVVVAEAVIEGEAEGVAVIEAEAVTVAVADTAGPPTTIRGQQNWSVVEYRPVAKTHPYDAPRKLQLGPLIISQLVATVEQNCWALA